MSKVVYCNNCKHYELRDIDHICKARVRQGHTYLKPVKLYLEPEEQNKNNNCGFYECKWWRAWA